MLNHNRLAADGSQPLGDLDPKIAEALALPEDYITLPKKLKFSKVTELYSQCMKFSTVKVQSFF